MKRGIYVWLVVAVMFAFATWAHAEIFGTVRGVVHDPQHRPIADAKVELKSATSSWTQTTQTNQDGEFTFNPVPLGRLPDHRQPVRLSSTASETLTVASSSSPVLHFLLNIASVNQTATVTAQAATADVQSVTPTTLVDREDIVQTPGADRSNSLAMITDYVPAAYVTHDMLHMRGGHQVDWLIDGVPIPNTNIASNLGPVIDPKDIDYLEVQRGSYDAEYGDRTYGIFQHRAAKRIRAGRRGRTGHKFRKLVSNERSNQFRRAHRSLRLLREREWKSQQLRAANAHRGGPSRCGKRRRRLRVPHLQRGPEKSASTGRLHARGLLPDSLRSGSQLVRTIRSTTPASFETTSVRATAILHSPGSTHSIPIFCLRFRRSTTTTRPTTAARPTTFPSSRT